MATLVEVPHIGMDMAEVTIVEWLVADGDQVAKGDPILTIETDKTTYDLDAEVSGQIRELQGSEGDVIPVGAPLAWIVDKGETVPALPSKNVSESEPSRAPEPAAIEPVVPDDERPAAGNADSGARMQRSVPDENTPSVARRALASPAARREAAARGIDVGHVAGSGPDGVVYQADIEAAAAQFHSPVSRLPFNPSAGGDIVELTRIQRITGERTQASFRDTPHFYLEREIEIDALLALREELAARHGRKPSLGCMLCFAMARTLVDHPRLNSRLVSAERLEVGRSVHLSVAVASKAGLVVPVLHHADSASFKAFSERYVDLAKRASANRLSAEEVSGGTFTVSNLGMFGIDRFSAIINSPQSAIVALGRRRTIPVWQDGEWVPRTVISATLSVDHRAADGKDGALFLADLAERINHWSLLL